MSWQIDGELWKQCQTLFWGGSKTTADDCSHEIKRRWFLGRKVKNNLGSIFKSRDNNYFANKVPASQGYGFPSCLDYFILFNGWVTVQVLFFFFFLKEWHWLLRWSFGFGSVPVSIHQAAPPHPTQAAPLPRGWETSTRDGNMACKGGLTQAWVHEMAHITPCPRNKRPRRLQRKRY